jgi:chemotaxis protein CheC
MEHFEIQLNEDQRDCLQELMNISYGEATAAISKIIDRFATLAIPVINSVTAEELKEHLFSKLDHNTTFYVAHQLINGDLAGENLFIIDKQSSINLATEFDLEADEIEDDDLEDIVLEITNILSSTTSSKLASMIDAKVSFSAPSVNYITSKKEFEKNIKCEYEDIIIISTELKFEDRNIQGELVLMKHKNSSLFLKNALDVFIEEF